MKVSEAKRAATRQKSVEQYEANKSMLDALRDEMGTAAASLEEDGTRYPGTPGYAMEEKDDYTDTYFMSPFEQKSSPRYNRFDEEEDREGRSEAGGPSVTSRDTNKTNRSSIRMSLTPRSISPPLQRGGAGPQKSVLKGGDYWKAQKDGGKSGGGSKLYVKSQEQVEREKIDPQDYEKLKRQLELVTEERDSLLKDKDTWLMRVKQDNVKLAGMLKHVKGLKAELVKAVDEVMTEKMALRSMKADYLKVSMEEYLLGDDCAVSESRRKFFPQAKKESASVFCTKLMKLSAGCRQNQTEVLEYVQELVQEAESAFVKGDQKTTDIKLNALESVASASPGNVPSAQAVVESMTEGVVGALSGHAAEVLAARAAHLSEYDSTGVDARLAAKDDEIQALLTANENLKANVSQMRKKYQQVLEQATKKSANASAAGKKKDSLFLDDAKDRHHGKTGKMSLFHQDGPGNAPPPHSGRGRSVASRSDAGGGGHHGHGAHGHGHIQLGVQMPKVQAEDLKLSASFDTLPFELRKQANEILTKYVTTVVNAHPLSTDLRPIVIKETINEVSTAMHGVVGLALTAYVQQGELSLTDSDRKTVKDLLGKVMALPSLQHEVGTYTHMLLTYLFSRYSSATTPTASTNMVIKETAGEESMPSLSLSQLTASEVGAPPAVSMPGRGGGAGTGAGSGNPFTGSSATSASASSVGVRFSNTNTGAGVNNTANNPGAGVETSSSSSASGIRFNKANMPKQRQAKKAASKPGDPAASKGTGEYGNVFFASGSAEEITLMTLEPSPREKKPKTNPNLPAYMQPVPKKRDRR